MIASRLTSRGEGDGPPPQGPLRYLRHQSRIITFDYHLHIRLKFPIRLLTQRIQWDTDFGNRLRTICASTNPHPSPTSALNLRGYTVYESNFPPEPQSFEHRAACCTSTFCRTRAKR